MPIIEVNHVTKEYRLGALHSLKQSAQHALARLRGETVPQRPLFKALDDVDFTVEEGEVLGIIGTNGAGKSTLLKMLARISVPTRGSVKVHGKVAPLIEVGAGLIGDLTGRENVYLNGAILGIPKAEIARKFDEIVAFAELEEFIDTPIKRYSSGMSVRLGFAIATSVESDILIVDEVLAVGDLAFQRKCFDRMEDMIRRQGKTVLLVSHNIRQVERISTRVLLLNKGSVLADGKPMDVCNLFYERSDEKIRLDAITNKISTKKDSVAGDIELIGASIVNKLGQSPLTSINYQDDFIVTLKFRSKSPIRKPVFGIGVHTTDFVYLSNQDTRDTFYQETIPPGVFSINCKVKNFPFLPGVYSLRIGLSSGEVMVFYAENILHFSVHGNAMSLAYAKEQGFVELNTDWTLESKITALDTPPA